jgi:catalase
VRGLGLQFTMSDGQLWRTAMINLPVFVFRTPEAFYEQLLASKPDPSTGKPDQAKMDAFLARHPETVEAFKIIKAQGASSGFDNTTFYGLNAFWFVNAAGGSTPVRWLLTPEQPAEAVDAKVKSQNKNYLFDALIEKIHHKPLGWHLVLIVGKPGDPTNDATLAWPAEREHVDVGTLTLDHVESDDTSPATGITSTDDPLLSARSAVYSQSFVRRSGERKEPSAITPAEVGKGQ